MPIIKLMKKIGSHSFVYSIGYIFTSLASVLLLPVYTRYLSKVDYGTLSLADQSIYYIKVVFFLGGSAAVTRFYNFYDRQKEKNKVISSGLCLSFFSTSLGVLILILFSETISVLIFGTIKYVELLYLAGIILMSESILSVGLAYLSAEKKSKRYLFYNLLQLFLGVSLNLYFIVVLKTGVYGMMYGQSISNIIMCVLVTFYVIRKVGFNVDFSILKKMMYFGLPLVPTTIFSAMMHNSDQYMIRYLTNLSAVGIYSIGYKLSFSAYSIYAVSLGLIWGSSVIYEIDKKVDSSATFSRLSTYLMAIVIFYMLSVSVFSEELIKLLVSEDYYDAIKIIPIICFGLIFYAFHIFLSVGVNIKNKTYLFAITSFVASSTNIVLNYFFILEYGYIGAAYATFITYFVYSFVSYLIYKKLYSIDYEWFRLGSLLFASLVIYSSSIYVDTGNLFGDIFLKSLLIFMFPFILFLIGFYKREEIGKLREVLFR